jgi:hypothetical protein
MKRSLAVVTVPFPPRMMSTSRNPTAMSAEYARDVLNMFTLSSGAGCKRNGLRPVGEALPDSQTMTRLMPFVDLAGDVQLLAATDEGNIYQLTDAVWTLVHSGLNPAGHVRWTHFANHLILCNGVDTPLKWDGSTFTPLSEWVPEQGANLTFVNANSLSVESAATVYPAGTRLRLKLGSVEVETTVASASQTGATTTLTLADSVATDALDGLFYEAFPPAFSFMVAAHDRLWGIGTGALSAKNLGAGTDRMRVYYTHQLNNPDGWRSPEGFLRYINLADKTPTGDTLIGMGVKDGLTVFFGRNHTQLWSGTDPSLQGDFSWQKTLPVGTIHADLITDLPNDIGFFTRYGARTLSRVLQTEQLDVSDLGSDVDPTIAQAVFLLTQNDTDYRNAHTFANDRQGWFGFKLGSTVLVYQVASAAAGWSRFDGLFADATAFANTPDGELYLGVGGQLYRYDTSVYDDDGVPITTRWWTPWLNFSGNFKRWANKYVELVTEQGAPVAMTLRRYKSYNSSSSVSHSVTATTPADYWNTSDWDTALWDNGYPKPASVRDGFVADVLSYAVESQSTEGPLTIFGFKLYGRQER